MSDPMHTLTGACIQEITSHIGTKQIRKSGGSADLRLQAEIMTRAGNKVFPYVYSVSHSSHDYVMERLLPSPAPLSCYGVAQRLLGVLGVLPKIWRYAPLEFARECTWQLETTTWLECNVPWLLPAFQKLYDQGAQPVECLIHGDPTLANTMLDEGLALRLIDPAPPRYAVPQLPEVDLGKLLQSMAGWEAVLDARWPVMETGEMEGTIDDLCCSPALAVLDCSISQLRERMLFWGAFHCARLMVRYTERAEIAHWGLAGSRTLLEMMT